MYIGEGKYPSPIYLTFTSKNSPTSKTCNECGEVNHELQLSDREWVCKSCGSVIDRDYNAAKNIRDEGSICVRHREP